jgi:hypothetical protein
MNINMTYVWAAILAYTALVMLALSFNHGADDRLDDSPKRKTKLGVSS